MEELKQNSTENQKRIEQLERRKKDIETKIESDTTVVKQGTGFLSRIQNRLSKTAKDKGLKKYAIPVALVVGGGVLAIAAVATAGTAVVPYALMIASAGLVGGSARAIAEKKFKSKRTAHRFSIARTVFATVAAGIAVGALVATGGALAVATGGVFLGITGMIAAAYVANNLKEGTFANREQRRKNLAAVNEAVAYKNIEKLASVYRKKLESNSELSFKEIDKKVAKYKKRVHEASNPIIKDGKSTTGAVWACRANGAGFLALNATLKLTGLASAFIASNAVSASVAPGAALLELYADEKKSSKI